MIFRLPADRNPEAVHCFPQGFLRVASPFFGWKARKDETSPRLAPVTSAATPRDLFSSVTKAPVKYDPLRSNLT
jgi:hypothetical protein